MIDWVPQLTFQNLGWGTWLEYELSKECANVVEVVEQEEDGEADGEAEDDREGNQDLPQMLWPTALLRLSWALWKETFLGPIWKKMFGPCTKQSITLLMYFQTLHWDPELPQCEDHISLSSRLIWWIVLPKLKGKIQRRHSKNQRYFHLNESKQVLLNLLWGTSRYFEVLWSTLRQDGRG